MRLAGVIVLYNPDKEVVIDNINSYINQVEILIAIDNSDKITHQNTLIDFLKQKNVIYINNGGNLGIARALNIGAEKAIELGYEWLLTMDQDSKASNGMINELLASTKIYKKNKIGLIAPRYILQNELEIEDSIEEVLTTITSGSLISLKAYSKIGKFRDELFIDFVDHEYCLRLNLHGYKVLINNQVYLSHRLGNSSSHSIFGRKYLTSNHNYIRRYYITRNRLTVINQFKKSFPNYYKAEVKSNIIEILKVFIFEKDKYRKLTSIIRGYLDYKRQKFGKIKV